MHSFSEVRELFKGGKTDNGVMAAYEWNGEEPGEDYFSYINAMSGSNINKLLIKLDIKPNDAEWLKRLEGVLNIANKNRIKVILKADDKKTAERILNENPETALKRMACHVQHTYVDREVYIIPDNAVSVTAMENRNGTADGNSAADLRPLLHGSFLRYNTPSNKYEIYTVHYTEETDLCDYTHAYAGEYVLKMWDWLYSSLPLFLRQSICGICVSEHMQNTVIYSESVCRAIRKLRGCDVTKFLPAIFHDIGPLTQQIRLDYGHTAEKLYEDNYSNPLCEWLNEKKLVRYTLDGDRPYRQDETEYIYEIKDRSSFYAETVKAAQEGYSHILLTELEGAGNIFTSPLAGIAGEIVQYLNRIMLLSSLGKSAADIAVLYPETTIHGGEGAKQAEKTLDKACCVLREENCLFDVISEKTFMSLETDNGVLKNSSSEYRIIVLPSLYSMRNEHLEKIIGFLKDGGTVLMLEEEPYASESGGRENKLLLQYKKELLGGKYAFVNGRGFSFCLDSEELRELLREQKKSRASGEEKLDYICRRTDDADYYMLFNAAEQSEYTFASLGGAVQLLPESGELRRIYPQRMKNGITTLRFRCCSGRVCILAFNRNEKALPVLTGGLSGIIDADGETVRAQASYVLKGKKRAYLQTPQITYVMEAEADKDAPEGRTLDGLWMTRINNNRPYLPLTSFECTDKRVYAGEGVKLLMLGPFPEESDTVEIEREISTLRCPDMEDVYEVDGHEYKWSEYSYSDTIDSLDGYGRFVCKVANESAVKLPHGKCYLWTGIISEQDDEVELLSGYRPRRLYINGAFYDSNRRLRLKAGINNILMRFDSGCETYLHFRSLLRMEADSQNEMLRYKYDPYPYRQKETCVLDTAIPQNASGLVLKAFSEPTVYIDGARINIAGVSGRSEKSYRYVIGASADGKRRKLTIELAGTEGCYGGGVLAGPAELYFRDSPSELEALYGLECLDGLRGSIVYEKTFFIDEENTRIYLTCGGVSGTAVLSVNNSRPLLMLDQPYKADITELVQYGNNKLTVTVYSPWQEGLCTGLSETIKLSFENVLSLESSRNEK